MKKKLIIYSFVVVLISVLFASIIQYYSITSTINHYRDSVAVSMKNASFSIQKVFSSVFNDLLYLSERKELSITKDFGLKDERTRQLNDFKAFVSNKKIYDQLRYIDKTGQEILRVNYNKGDVVSVDESKLQSKSGSYYVDDALGLNDGEIYISRFDLNKEKGKIEKPIKPMIRFVTPFMNNHNQLDGLIVFNYLGENLINDLKEVDHSANSSIQLVNGDGYYLYNGDESKEWAFMRDEEEGFFKDYPEAWDKIKKEKNYDFETSKGLFSVLPVDPDQFAENLVGSKMNQNESNNFYVVVYVEKEIIAKVYREGLIKGIVIFLITAFIGSFLVRLYITKKEDEEKHKKSLEENLEFNKTVVDKTQSSADIISKVSSEIYDATEDANRGLQQIIHELNNVTTSINDNANTIEQSNDQIESIAEKSYIVESMSRDAVKKNKDIVGYAEEGNLSIEELTSMISKISKSTDYVFEEIGELVAKSNEIGQIITLITDITEQTNLLALNAAIEAARAGEHGKGFAVVAEEVRKLADVSGKSATKISQLIIDVQEKAKTSDEFITESRSIVEESVKKSEEANKQFSAISSEIIKMSKLISEITTKSTEQHNLTKVMKDAMAIIIRNTEVNTAAVNDINDVIQNQAASFEEIGASIEELSSMSDELNSISKMNQDQE